MTIPYICKVTSRKLTWVKIQGSPRNCTSGTPRAFWWYLNSLVGLVLLQELNSVAVVCWIQSHDSRMLFLSRPLSCLRRSSNLCCLLTLTFSPCQLLPPIYHRRLGPESAWHTRWALCEPIAVGQECTLGVVATRLVHSIEIYCTEQWPYDILVFEVPPYALRRLLGALQASLPNSSSKISSSRKKLLADILIVNFFNGSVTWNQARLILSRCIKMCHFRLCVQIRLSSL